MPNVGKSTTFNIMCNMSVAAENFPFCTIDPSEARVEVPDPAFHHLCEKFKPKSEVPAFLTVCDIAGLVKGASEGEGLGNAFLSHINATGAMRSLSVLGLLKIGRYERIYLHSTPSLDAVAQQWPSQCPSVLPHTPMIPVKV